MAAQDLIGLGIHHQLHQGALLAFGQGQFHRPETALEFLEGKFNDKVKILPVTEEKESAVLQFLKNNKFTQGLKNTSVVEDKLFRYYFKHHYIPHEIWVYNGKIIGVTSLEYVDEYNINQVLNKEIPNWPIKNDFYVFDRNKSLFSLNDKQIDILSTKIQYSAISDFRKNNNTPIWLSGGNGIQRDSLKGTVRTYFLNQSILNSYLVYWSFLIDPSKLNIPYFSFQPNQVIWEVSDRSKYTFEGKKGVYPQDWLVKNGICFESLYPDTGQSDKRIYYSAISDLNRLLKLKVRWEKRNEKVLVLKKSNTSNVNVIKMDISKEKYSIFDIFIKLNEQSNNPYVFNESGVEKTQLPLKITSWSDILGISRALRDYGFELIEEERTVDKLIFTEVDRDEVYYNKKIKDY